MNRTNAVEHIVIVGGGSAGWMTAAMLASQLQGNCRMTLVESDDIATVGVGEATIPPIKRFNAIMGIDEYDFLSKCNGSIKLGIQFENWPQRQHSYFHQFGRFGVDFDYMPLPYFYFQQHEQGHALPIQEYSAAWQLAKRNKFIPPADDPRSLFSGFDYAYHFDASLYARYLRNYAEQRGVTRKEGKVVSVQQQPQSGFITELVLQSGEVVSGDFFIDCSGTRSLLLGGTVGVDFGKWSAYLINDRAVATQSSLPPELHPYTRAVAHEAGWQWRIPLQTRMGSGNVFNSQCMTTQQAMDKLLSTLDGKVLIDPKEIKFTTGRRQVFWQHNCVAIGLAAGFLEPLESTSLHLTQRGIMRLVSLFPDKACSQVNVDEYNRQTIAEYEHIRDFIILHYHATGRDDSDYWNYCRQMAIPDSLQQRLELFKLHGHLRIDEKDLFKQDSWIAVLLGQNIFPATTAPILQFKQQIDVPRSLAAMHKTLVDTAQQITGHEQYLSKHCRYRPLA